MPSLPPSKKKPSRDPKKEQRQLQRDVSDMLDLHLRFGLEDQHIRLSKKDWGVVMESWLIAGEDIVMRCLYKSRETNIILRGTYHAILTISGADPERHLPVYNCFSISDIRRKKLEEQGA